MELTIFRKALILVSVPLVFQLALIAIVAELQRRSIDDDFWVDHTKEVLARTEVVQGLLVDLESASRGYAICMKDPFTEPFEEAEKSIPVAIEELNRLIVDNPRQVARVDTIKEMSKRFVAWHRTRFEEVSGGERQKAQDKFSSLEGKSQMDALRREIEAFRETEQALDADRIDRRDDGRRTLQLLLVVGVTAAFSITLVVASAFIRGIVRRMLVLSDNAARLGRGEELLAPVGGTDEISKVDAAFHDMARSVRLYTDIVKNVSLGLLILRLENAEDDRSLRIVEANPAASELLGIEAKSILGCRLIDAFPANPPELLKAYADVVRTGTERPLEDIHYGDDRVKAAYWSVKAFPLPYRKVGVAFENITARKEAEHSVRRLNEELEHRVEERTSQLAAANVDLVRKSEDNRRRAALIQAMHEAQAQFIASENPRRLFDGLLASFLKLTGSEHGFIDELLHDENGSPYLAMRAITSHAWSDESRALHPRYLSGEPVFANPKSPIADDPPNDSRRDRGPCLSPPPDTFLGLPMHAGGTFVGVVGLADAPGGYDEQTVAYLEPMLKGCANIIEALRNDRRRRQVEERLQQQLARMHLINRIAQSIGERQDLHSIHRVVLAELEENLPIDLSAVCSFDARTGMMKVEAVGPKNRELNVRLGLDEQSVFPVDSNGLSACLRGETVYEPDISQVGAPIPQRLAGGGLRSLAAAPLGIGSNVVGILLTARHEANGYGSVDCEFLRQLSGHVFLAAQHAQLYQDLKQAYDDLRESQKAVLQQERLRALGQMAAGIAHDINNAVSPIAIYSESLLETEPGLSPRARGYLTIIQKAIEDVADTVSRMREFYRRQDDRVVLVPVNLNSLIQHVLDLTRARWRDQMQQRGLTVNVRCELDRNLPMIRGVESELRDALTNLVFNAVDAMPNGGTMSLLTRVGDRDGIESRARLPQVMLEVSDTGIGMDDEVRRRCLEPFFTTKGERGTGLGLPMVYGTMQRHSGDIDILSTVGRGTTIRLCFPLPAESTDGRPVPERVSVPMRPLRLLIVDDDPLLRRSLEDALNSDGHRVTTADGGRAGIEAFQAALARDEPFEVVVTDLGMPHVDGREVARAVKESSPPTVVVMLTGWGRRMKSEGDVPAHVDHVLAKPPRLKELRTLLADVAEERKTPHVEQ